MSMSLFIAADLNMNGKPSITKCVTKPYNEKDQDKEEK